MRNFRGVYLWVLLVIVLSISSNAVFADIVFQTGTDKYNYLPSENVTIRGAVWDGTSNVTDATVNITITNTTSFSDFTVNTSSDGSFSLSYNISNLTLGQHNITAKYGGTTSNLVTFMSTNVVGAVGIIATDVYVSNLTNSAPIADPKWNTTKVFMNDTSLSPSQFPYYIAVDNASTNTGTYQCERLFVSSNTSFNVSKPEVKAKYLKEGNFFQINGVQYFVLYISPRCDQVGIVRPSEFKFSGGESIKIVATLVDSNRMPVSYESLGGSSQFEVFNNAGERINSTNVDSPVWGFTIPTTSGRYFMFLAGYPIGSFSVEKFTMKSEVLDSTNSPVFVIKPNGGIKVVADVINESTGKSISSGATVVAEYSNSSATGGKTSYSMSYDSSLGRWATELHAGPDAGGKRTYKVTATVGDYAQVVTSDVIAKSFEVSTIVLSKGKGEGSGFAPNQPAVILVTGRNMTDGTQLNLSNLTNNCANVGVSVTDSSGNDVQNVFDFAPSGGSGAEWYSFNLSYFFGSVITDAPSGVVDEFKRSYGEQSCAVVFNTPNQEGSFNTVVGANISGSYGEYHNSFSIQSLFVRGEPASDYRSGIWYFTPGSKVTMILKVMTADGLEIPAANISDASLVEVVAEENNTVVTDKMLNETFQNITLGGQTYSAISFVANDSIMGFHRVGFRVKAVVGSASKEAEGSGWFVEKKYHIFAYPRNAGGQWFFGANDNITLTVQVFDEQGIQSMGSSSGSNQSSTNENVQSISVTVDEIRSADGWSKVTNWQAGSGTTDGQGRANLNITQTSPWSGGSYVVKIKAVKSGVTDYGQGWFEVRNFNFWAYTQDWRTGGNQSIAILLQSYNGNWQPLNSTVRLTDIQYHGNSKSWVNVPVSFNGSAEWAVRNTSSGQGNITIPAGVITKSGFYEAVLNATTAAGASQTSRAFFEVIGFVMVVQKDRPQWDSFYAPGDVVNITITAGKKKMWGGWPPTVSDPVNISSAWIDDFRQEGMFDPMMKKGDTQENSLGLNTSTNCDGTTSVCQVWFNTTQLAAGRYNFQIIANDSAGEQANEFDSLQVKTFEIKSPELKLVRVPTTSEYRFTNASSIKTDKDWKSCSDTQLTKPDANPNVTNCKAIDAYNMTDGGVQTTVSILVDIGNNKLYVDAGVVNDYDFNLSKVGNQITIVNISSTIKIDTINYTLVSVGDTVALQSSNAIMRDSGGNGKADYVSTMCDMCPPETYALAVYYVNDTAADYYAAFKNQNNWNGMRDDNWLQIDLDGDNDYNDAWHLVLKTRNNVVQNVYVANETNITKSFIKVYPGPAPANFTKNGTQIYFVGASYVENTGSSGYEVKFTSNRTGWSGMDLGTFGNNVNVSVPVYVIGTSRIANANVSLYKVTPLGMGPPNEQNPTVVATARTDANGLAILRFNTSWLGATNGRYALKFNATSGGKSGQSTGMPWEWPAIERRDFKLRISSGTFGSIPVKEMSTSAGNLFNYTLYEASGQKFATMNSICGDNNYISISDYRYNRLVMNLSDAQSQDRVFVANEGENLCASWPAIRDRADSNYTAGQTMKIPRSGWTEFVNLTRILRGGVDNTTLNYTNLADRSSEVFEALGLNVTITESNGVPQIKTKCKFLEWNWEVDDTFSWHPEGDTVCQGMLTVHLDVPTSVANFTINPYVLALQSPWNLSLGGEWKTVKVANITDTDYELVYYDDANIINGENWAGRNLMTNPPRPDGFTYADRVLLINSTNGAPITTTSPTGKYFLGDLITELNKSVFGGQIWESNIFLTNESGAPYPIPWVCDNYNRKFYFGNFSESDVGVDLNAQGFNPMNPPAPNASEYYSTLLYDNECDGNGAISGGMYDDDRELYQRSACPNGGDQMNTPGGCQEVSIDFYGTSGKSGGAPNEIVTTSASEGAWMGGPQDLGERMFKLGEGDWRLTFVNDTIQTTDGYGNLSVLRETQNFNSSQDVAYYIKARKLDGTPVEGTATVLSVFDFMNFAPVDPPTDSASIISGVGVLRLNNFTGRFGSYAVTIKVCDTASSLCETMESPVFIGSMDQIYKMGEPSGGGGGGGGGY